MKQAKLPDKEFFGGFFFMILFCLCSFVVSSIFVVSKIFMTVFVFEINNLSFLLKKKP